MFKVKLNILLISLCLFLAGFLSRYFLAEKTFSALDSVQYTLGSMDFSIQRGNPPAPGYFLYIMTGKFLTLFFKDPQNAMVMVSVIYSGLIAALLFIFGRELFSVSSGIIASLLFLASPVFWYKGITIYGHLNSGFFILLTAFFCYKVIRGREKFIYFASISYALLVGTRPQELPMLILLFLFTLFFASHKAKIACLFVFLAATLIWFVPLIKMSGGLSAYLTDIIPAAVSSGEYSVFSGEALAKLNGNLIRMGMYFQRTFFLSIVPLFYYLGKFFYLPNFYNDRKVQFLSLLILPTLLFNVFIRFSEIGHGMAWGLAVLLLAAEAMVVISKDAASLFMKIFKIKMNNQLSRKVSITLLALISIFILTANAAMFLKHYDFDMFSYHRVIYDDRQFNYSDVKKVDDYLMAKVNFIKRNFNPKDTLIVSSNRFLQQVMYYFPQALTVYPAQLTGRKVKSGLSIYHNRECVNIKEDYLRLPPGINTMIIFDGALIPYLKTDKHSRLIKIKNAMDILAVDLKEYNIVEFGDNSIVLK
ncbi:MAG: hypothetical protein WC628_10270 [Candidatus Omnitrophota bacterium]